MPNLDDELVAEKCQELVEAELKLRICRSNLKRALGDVDALKARVAELEQVNIEVGELGKDAYRELQEVKGQLAAYRGDAEALRAALDDLVCWCKPLCKHAYDLGEHDRECPVERAQAALSGTAGKGRHSPEEWAVLQERITELIEECEKDHRAQVAELEQQIAELRSVTRTAPWRTNGELLPGEDAKFWGSFGGATRAMWLLLGRGEIGMRCCYLDPMTRAECQATAEWELWATNSHPSETTQACTQHVGELLTDAVNHVWPLRNLGEKDSRA